MQSGKLIAGTLCQHFYRAIVIIANPSGDAQDVRLTLDEPTEADALHPSADEKAAGLDGFFTRSHFGLGVILFFRLSS